MKAIPLTRGLFALVDDDDYSFLMQWKWHAVLSKGQFYAIRTERIGSKRFPVRMARVIAGAVQGQVVDHIDRSTLNNQRNNLRLCSQHKNTANKGMHKNNTSGFKGVFWDKEAKRWKFVLAKNRKIVAFGRFNDVIEAARAYDEAAIRTWGDYAATNVKLGRLPAAEPKEPRE